MIYGKAPTRSPLTPQELDTYINTRPTPAGEYFGTNVVDAFNRSVPGAMANEIGLPDDDLTGRISPSLLKEWQNKNPGRAPVTKDEYLSVMEKSGAYVMNHDDWLNSPYYRKDIPFDNRMTIARAKFKSEAYDAQQYRDFLRQNRENGIGTFGLALAGGILGTLPDPTNYIPVFGNAFKAAAATRVANITRRAAVGALDAGIQTALVDAVVLPQRKQFGDDVSWAEAFLDVAIGAATGGILGAAGATRERLATYDTKVAQEALQGLSEGADAFHNNRPIQMEWIASHTQERLMQGTSLSTRPAVPIPEGALRPAKPTIVSIDGGIMPITDSIGRPISYPTKSQAEKAMREFKKAGIATQIRENRNGTFHLIEPAKMTVYDTFATPEAAKNAIKRMAPDVRKGLEVVPVEVTGRRMFAITEGLNIRQLEAVRNNPNVVNEVIASKYPEAHTPVKSEFDKAFDAANPFKPVPARKLIYTTEQIPEYVPEQVKKQVTASVGKPAGNIENIAKEMGIDLATGAFDELENVEHLVKAGAVNKTALAELEAADELIKKADDYVKALDQAVFCIGRRS